MQQEIGFATASDGCRIAYATCGEGPPLVYVTGWPVHLELEWEKPAVRRFLEDLARGFTLVRYDMRGSGLSDRDVSDLSVPSLVCDLEAVVDHLSLASSSFSASAISPARSPLPTPRRMRSVSVILC